MLHFRIDLSLGSLMLDPRGGSSAPAYDPATMFALGEEGWLYKISDISTMFQNAAGTLAAAEEALVGKLNDESGRGHHLTQATAANQFRLRRDENGALYLDPEGRQCFMTGTGPSVATMGGNLSKTLFAALRCSAAANRTLILYGDELPDSALGFAQLSSGKRSLFQWLDDHLGTGTYGTDNEVWTGIKNGNLLTLRVNGVNDGAPATAGAANITSTTLRIGGSDDEGWWAGRLYGLIGREGLPDPAEPEAWLTGLFTPAASPSGGSILLEDATHLLLENSDKLLME